MTNTQSLSDMITTMKLRVEYHKALQKNDHKKIKEIRELINELEN